MFNKSEIPVVILAGGYGSRLSEKTNLLPKPMIEIGGRPILHHIINIFIKQGFKRFFILGGYKHEIIMNYFRGWCGEIESLKITFLKKENFFKKEEKITNKCNFDLKMEDVSISVINTGLNTLTGGRLGRILTRLEMINLFLRMVTDLQI